MNTAIIFTVNTVLVYIHPHSWHMQKHVFGNTFNLHASATSLCVNYMAHGFCYQPVCVYYMAHGCM